MNSNETPGNPKSQAADHVADAQQLLQRLQEEIGKHPTLDEAITKLELALSALTLQTGGLL